MSSIYQHITRAYLAYLKYLGSGGKRYELPKTERSGLGNDQVYASALCKCPLKNAKNRYNVPKTHPNSDAEELASLHKMRQGERDAEPIQEALMWFYGKLIEGTEMAGALTEVNVAPHPNLPVRGRMDALLQLRINGVTERHIIEIKRKDPFMGVLSPKIGDIYQTMAYMLLTGIPNGHIITIDRNIIKVWTLHRTGDGFTLSDERGEAWKSVEGYNSPDWLNYNRLTQEVCRQLSYMQMIAQDPYAVIPPPIADPVNEHNGWECIIWIDGEKPKVYKTKENKPAYIKRRCEWFCHSAHQQEVYLVTVDDNNVRTAHYGEVI